LEQALLTILRTEGPFALYAGLAPNMLGSTIAWGSYFYCYNFLRGKAREYPRLIDGTAFLFIPARQLRAAGGCRWRARCATGLGASR
jgi:hypothetical protein